MTCIAPPVVLACRSLARGENLKADLVREAQNAGVVEPDVQVMELDLASLDSVRRFSDAWEERGRHIDILVNNAGVFAMGGECAPQTPKQTCAQTHTHTHTHTHTGMDTHH
jgi:NAD(P)-dependent dehydrogenase (short-subunit alcohol dehydrogenase family)